MSEPDAGGGVQRLRLRRVYIVLDSGVSDATAPRMSTRCSSRSSSSASPRSCSKPEPEWRRIRRRVPGDRDRRGDRFHARIRCCACGARRKSRPMRHVALGAFEWARTPYAIIDLLTVRRST